MSKKNKKHRRKNKRKNHGCLKCFTSLLVFMVVLTGILYGGAYFAWGKFVEPKAGMNFNDALSIVGGLYGAKESEVVTNPYKEEDLNSFYTNVSEALYLDDTVDLRENIFEVLDEVIAQKNNSEETTTEGETVSAAEESSTEENSTEGSSGTGNDILDEFLSDLKFDFSSIKDYDEETATDQVLTLTDKQTAAFLDDTITGVLTRESVKDLLGEQLKGVSLENTINIPQVKISSDDYTDLSKVKLTLTVKISTKTLAKNVLKGVMPQISFLGGLLPKYIFATISIYPNNYEAESEIQLNSFNDAKMSKVYSALNMVMANTEYQSINGLLKMVNQKAIEAIEKVQEVMPVDFVYSSDSVGSVQTKPIQAVMKALKVTDLTEAQFFCMIRDVALQDFDDIKTDLKFDETTTRSSISVALSSAGDSTVEEISSKYAIEDGYLTKDNIFTEITTINNEDSVFLDKVSLANLTYSETYVAKDNKAEITYLGLSSLLNSYIKDKVTSNLKFEIINMYYEAETDNLAIVLEAKLLDMVAESMSGSSLYTLVSQIIPENIYITAYINLETSSTDLAINGKTVEQTKNHLETLSKLTASFSSDSSSLSYDSLTSTVNKSVTDGLNSIKDQLGVEIIFESEYVYLPNIYEIVSGKILYKEGNENNLTDEEVYFVFKDITEEPKDYSSLTAGKTTAKEAFVSEVEGKYAVNSGYLTVDNIYDELTNVTSDTSQLINNISIENLTFTATYNATNNKVVADYLALTDLVNSKVTPDSSSITYTIINISYDQTNDILAFTLEADILSLISDGLEKDSNTYKLITSSIPEKVYLTAYVNRQTNEVNLELNEDGIPETKKLFASLEKMMKLLNSTTDLSYTSLTTKVGDAVSEGLKNVDSQLGTEIVYSKSSAYLPSIYEVMSNKILYKETETENLTDEEVYFIFKDIKEVPEAYSGVNKASDMTNFVEQVNTKYAINPLHAIKVPESETDETIVSQIQNLGSNYNTAILGAQLASAWSTATSGKSLIEKQAANKTGFNPYALEDEAASIFDAAVNIEVSGLSSITLNKVVVESESIIRMIYSGTYTQGEGTKDYSNLIPDFVVNVTLDVSKIKTTDTCVNVTINDMSSDNLTKFGLMCKRLTNTDMKVETLNTDVDTKVKESLGTLFEKLTLTLDKSTSSKIYFGSMFDIVYNNTTWETTDTYTSIDVADTISALHSGLSVTMQDGSTITDADKYDANNIDYSGSDLTNLKLNVKADITARNLGQALKEAGFDSFTTNLGITSSPQVYQIAVLNMDDATYSGKITTMKESLSNLTSGVTSGKYLITTLSIATSGVYESTLLPENLYINALISLDNGDVSVGYNNLSESELTVVNRLAGGKEAFNTTTAATEMKEYIMGDGTASNPGVKVVSFTYTVSSTTAMTALGIAGKKLSKNVYFRDVIEQTDPGSTVTVDLYEETSLCGTYNINYNLTFTTADLVD